MTDHLELIDATAAPAATVTFELLDTPAFGNRIGNMHGGVVALVYDMCTTMCVASLSQRDF
jgi:acyl-coenzyme A thioesterase 13